MTLLLDCPTSAPATAAGAVTNDAATIETLVRSNLPLVGHLVREVINRVPAHVNRDDLSSAGMYALTLSAKTFDGSLGVPFARFAAIRIRGALTDELRTMDWASRGVRGRARELNTVRDELTHLIGREPSRMEIATAMGISLTDLSALEADVRRAGLSSLQALSAEDGAAAIASADCGPEDLLVRREQIGYLRDAIAELPAKLRLVVEEYFFGQRKMAEIAQEIGVTESRVSQLRSEALLMLRAAMTAVDAPAAADAAPARGRGRAAVQQAAYCAAVSTRSSVSGRLAATTVLGETHSSNGVVGDDFAIAN
ncbi:MAG: sigma-70 family RNA polymerase sigma factor [Jatrophihabitantaceae bacterium]